MTKSDLRLQFLAQRRALPAEEVTRRSKVIAERFFEHFMVAETPSTLHLFLPIARQNEVDTWLITQRIWQEFPAIQVAVSVTDRVKDGLTHHAIDAQTPLYKNRWGIPEPEPNSSTVVLSDQIGLVLVPLLAFDAQGHRVGYGKGYYDRFLAECRPDCLKVGLSLFGPVACIADTWPGDRRLDSCVTPEEVIWFKEK